MNSIKITTSIGEKQFEKKLNRKTKRFNKVLPMLIALFFAFFVGWIILISVGYNPLDYYEAIILGNFGSMISFGNFLGTLSWMLLIGLAMVVSFRANLFNIGSTGQMIAGGLFGYLFAISVNIGSSGVIFSILIPTCVGMFIGYLIGYLKVNFNIHEVISSIMFNWIIYWTYKFFTNPSNAPWIFSGSFTKSIIPSNSLRIPGFMEGTTMNMMLFFAIALIIIFIFMYTKTRWGVKQNIIGKNVNAAKYSGINVGWEVQKNFLISGGLSGLAGATFYLGVNQNLPLIGTEIPAEGFNGITVALIGFNTPIGMAISSILVGALYNARAMISVNVNPYISDLILGLIVWSMAITNFFIIYSPQKKFMKKLDNIDFFNRKKRKQKSMLLNEQKTKVEKINIELKKMEIKNIYFRKILFKSSRKS